MARFRPVAGALCCLTVALLTLGNARASDTPLPVHWLVNYDEALASAKAEGKWLLVWMFDPASADANAALQSGVLDQPAIGKRLAASFVAVKLPLSATTRRGEREVRLIEQSGFAELRGRPGLAIVDQTDENSPLFGQVVSVYPFYRRGITAPHLAELLDLPHGTLTQRTLIFAIRTHRDRPASARGHMHPLLSVEAQKHSIHQARIHLQGHHGWDARFQAINARLPAGHVAYEVCSESWPGQTMMDAAEECIDSWRQSSGHWGQVSRQASYYGYDMRQGRNGVWYATGIFGRRR
jgi:hypothetical protein